HRKPFRQHVTGNVYSTEENGKGPISMASIPDLRIDGQRFTHWRKMPALWAGQFEGEARPGETDRNAGFPVCAPGGDFAAAARPRIRASGALGLPHVRRIP